MPPLGSPAPRRWPVPATLVVVALLLGGWWQPWRTRGVPPASPTPQIAPAPTGTPAQPPDRLTLPTPLRPITPSPVRPLVSAPVRSVTPGLLLYLGRLDGPPGIVAVNAAGGDRRLLAPGVYVALAWSPDGARFAALGGNGYEQLAIFAADGRPLARYPVRAGTQCDLRWSPDSRTLTCVPTYPFQGQERTTFLIADDNGLRSVLLPPVVRTAILGWPRPGVLGLVALPEEWPYAAAEVWLVDLASGAARRLIQGDFSPLGWAADGATLLVLGGRQPRGGTVQPGEPVFTELIAIDTTDTIVTSGTASGARRTLTQAFQLARDTIGSDPLTRRWFSSGTLSPTGRELALWIARDAPRGAPATPNLMAEVALVLLDLRDTGDPAMTRFARPDGGTGVGYGWSPDGRAFALPRYRQPDGELALEIVIPADPIPQVYPLSSREGAAISWSPDGRWFAYNSPTGLAIADVGTANSAILDPEGRAPAWRPAAR